MSPYPVFVGTWRARRMDGYCALCECLTSEPDERLPITELVACWFCGNTALDFTYHGRVLVGIQMRPGALLSDILGTQTPPEPDPASALTIIERWGGTIPPECQWYMEML